MTKSLHNAFVDVAISGVKHIVLSMTPKGKLVACGSSEVIEAMMNDLTYKESLVGKGRFKKKIVEFSTKRGGFGLADFPLRKS